MPVAVANEIERPVAALPKLRHEPRRDPGTRPPFTTTSSADAIEQPQTITDAPIQGHELLVIVVGIVTSFCWLELTWLSGSNAGPPGPTSLY